jgi:hypothetical protein
MMMNKGFSLKDAFHHMTTTTPWDLNINYGFKAQLMNLELRHLGQEEVTFAVSLVLNEIPSFLSIFLISLPDVAGESLIIPR